MQNLSVCNRSSSFCYSCGFLGSFFFWWPYFVFSDNCWLLLHKFRKKRLHYYVLSHIFKNSFISFYFISINLKISRTNIQCNANICQIQLFKKKMFKAVILSDLYISSSFILLACSDRFFPKSSTIMHLLFDIMKNRDVWFVNEYVCYVQKNKIVFIHWETNSNRQKRVDTIL